MIVIKWPGTFVPYGGIQPSGTPSGDFSTFIAVYGRYAGEPFYTRVFKLPELTATAIDIPLELYTTGRGSLLIGGAGKGLWLQSYEGNTLVTQQIQGWTPPAWLKE